VCDKLLATERLAPVLHAHKGSGVAPREVHLKARSHLQKDMRAELLGEKEDNTGSY